jgi:hypothetical protein
MKTTVKPSAKEARSQGATYKINSNDVETVLTALSGCDIDEGKCDENT